MAKTILTVITSDLSGAELTDDTHATIIVKDHPQLRGRPVQLDVSTDESSKLQAGQIALVTMEIHEPNAPMRRVAIDAGSLAKLFKGIDLDDIISKAEAVEEDHGAPVRRRGRPAGTSKPKAAKGEKTNYADIAHAGRPHRGRITEAEKETVRENLKAINERLAKEGLRQIDPEDDEMQKKYFS